MTLPVDAQERAELRRFLHDRFDLDELREIAFDLAIDYEDFPHETKPDFVRGLIGWCERRDQLPCLLIEVLKRRESPTLAGRLASLSACQARVKVQIILGEDLVSKAGLKRQLAAVLGIAEDELALIAALPGSTRVLVGLPARDAAVLATSGVRRLDPQEYHLDSVTDFDALPLSARTEWKAHVIGGGPLWLTGSAAPTSTARSRQYPGQFPMLLLLVTAVFVGLVLLLVLASSLGWIDIASPFAEVTPTPAGAEATLPPSTSTPAPSAPATAVAAPTATPTPSPTARPTATPAPTSSGTPTDRPTGTPGRLGPVVPPALFLRTPTPMRRPVPW